jgi:hypothetical protein
MAQTVRVWQSFSSGFRVSSRICAKRIAVPQKKFSECLADALGGHIEVARHWELAKVMAGHHGD